MASRRAIQDPYTTEERYYLKQVRVHSIYSDLEDAKKVAEGMTRAWKSIFLELYSYVHNNPNWKRAMSSCMASAQIGIAVRYANYVLANYLFTGRISYDGFIQKLTSLSIPEEVASYIFTTTVCTALGVNYVKSFLTYVRPDLAGALVENCPKLSYEFSTDKYLLDTFASIYRQYPLPVVPRSIMYYIITEISVPRQVLAGSKGGEAMQPSLPSFVPISSNQIVNDISKLLATYMR